MKFNYFTPKTESAHKANNLISAAQLSGFASALFLIASLACFFWNPALNPVVLILFLLFLSLVITTLVCFQLAKEKIHEYWTDVQRYEQRFQTTLIQPWDNLTGTNRPKTYDEIRIQLLVICRYLIQEHGVEEARVLRYHLEDHNVNCWSIEYCRAIIQKMIEGLKDELDNQKAFLVYILVNA